MSVPVRSLIPPSTRIPYTSLILLAAHYSTRKGVREKDVRRSLNHFSAYKLAPDTQKLLMVRDVKESVNLKFYSSIRASKSHIWCYSAICIKEQLSMLDEHFKKLEKERSRSQSWSEYCDSPSKERHLADVAQLDNLLKSKEKSYKTAEKIIGYTLKNSFKFLRFCMPDKQLSYLKGTLIATGLTLAANAFLLFASASSFAPNSLFMFGYATLSAIGIYSWLRMASFNLKTLKSYAKNLYLTISDTLKQHADKTTE